MSSWERSIFDTPPPPITKLAIAAETGEPIAFPKTSSNTKKYTIDNQYLRQAMISFVTEIII